MGHCFASVVIFSAYRVFKLESVPMEYNSEMTSGSTVNVDDHVPLRGPFILHPTCSFQLLAINMLIIAFSTRRENPCCPSMHAQSISKKADT
jgi:hypothetical protein